MTLPSGKSKLFLIIFDNNLSEQYNYFQFTETLAILRTTNLMKKYIIWFIVGIGLLLRVIGLNSYPPGFTPDEASFGYDAYSLLHTGKDQWGHVWPLVLESFGDFKPPLYSYLLLPFVAIFGLEKWVVRFPNVLLGTAAIYITYLLVKEILRLTPFAQNDKNQKSIINNLKSLPIIASAILAISPWHIMLSRGAFEANLTTFFLPLGIYLFLRAKENRKLYFWSALIFGLNLFSYHSAKVVTPLIVVFLLLSKERSKAWSRGLSLKSLVSLIKNSKLFIGVFSLFVILTLYTFTLGAAARAKDINIFKGSLEDAARERTQAVLLGLNSSVARVFHSKYQVGIERFFDRYVDYFSPQFYFADGPGEATYGMIPGEGVMYAIEIFFLLYFIYSLSKYKEVPVIKLLIFWILIAPIPASLTAGPSFSGNRSAIMMPAITILTAFGLFSFLADLKKSYLEFAVPIVSFSYLILFLSYAFNYLYIAPFRYADKMLAGNTEMAEYIKENGSSYSQIVIDKKLSEPHIYIAFAEKFDPLEYQRTTNSWRYKDNGLTWVDQLPEYRLGKYVFRSVHITEYLPTDNVLLVGRPEDFPATVRPQKTIYYPSGTEALYIVDPKMNDYAYKN